MEHLTELGVGGIFVLLLLQVLMPHIVKMAKGGNATPKPAEAPASPPSCSAAQEIEDQVKLVQASMARMSTNMEKVSEVLSARDAEGLPLCYTPRSLGKSIEHLSLSISKLSDHIQAQ
jgi:hypothetical protein|tara:strand:- start:32 stop:385 length:354 start_codon:yes stop_codon:yes gene_type:complete